MKQQAVDAEKSLAIEIAVKEKVQTELKTLENRLVDVERSEAARSDAEALERDLTAARQRIGELDDVRVELVKKLEATRGLVVETQAELSGELERKGVEVSELRRALETAEGKLAELKKKAEAKIAGLRKDLESAGIEADERVKEVETRLAEMEAKHEASAMVAMEKGQELEQMQVREVSKSMGLLIK